MNVLILSVFFVPFLAWGCNKNNPPSSTAVEQSGTPSLPEKEEIAPNDGYYSFSGSSSEGDIEIPLREETEQVDEDENEDVYMERGYDEDDQEYEMEEDDLEDID